MTLDYLSPAAQKGLRLWALETLPDDRVLNAASSESWAWLTFLLWESPDKPEWFPKGKSATIQIIQMKLHQEAKETLGIK